MSTFMMVLLNKLYAIRLSLQNRNRNNEKLLHVPGRFLSGGTRFYFP